MLKKMLFSVPRFVLAFAFAFFAAQLHAQYDNGSLVGTIRDTTGAPIVRQPPNTPPDGNAPDTTQPPAQPKKKNFFQKIFGGGKDKEKDKQPESQQPPQ